MQQSIVRPEYYTNRNDTWRIITLGVARWATYVALLISFWSTLRIGSLAIFDLFSPVCVLLCLLVNRPMQQANARDLRVYVGIQIIFTVGVLVSAFGTFDIEEHVAKSFAIVSGMAIMFILLNIAVGKSIIKYRSAILALILSSTACSFFVILQGKFFLFRELNERLIKDDVGVIRPAGLAEHPIEAGAITSFGVLLCIHFLLSIQIDRSVREPGIALKALVILALGLNFWSLAYSASLTASFGLVAGIITLFVIGRRTKVLFALGIPAIIAIAPIALNPDTLLGDRLGQLLVSGDDYTTVQSRQNQIADTIDAIDLRTFFIGRGYSQRSLVGGLEIHNAFLAALYHFGIIGLMSQIFLIYFILKKVFAGYPARQRAILGGVFLVFLSLFLTGPVFARRSNWIAVVVLATYMPTRTYSRKNLSGKTNRASLPYTANPTELNVVRPNQP